MQYNTNNNNIMGKRIEHKRVYKGKCIVITFKPKVKMVMMILKMSARLSCHMAE